MSNSIQLIDFTDLALAFVPVLAVVGILFIKLQTEIDVEYYSVF